MKQILPTSERMMTATILGCLIAGMTIPVQSSVAGELNRLRVVYVGSERTDEFVEFLDEHVAAVDAVAREDFDPADAGRYDVVLLDWPQSNEAREQRVESSPLGERQNWSRPTVLLGSAGLNLACSWQLRGGSGCTCLDPVAYDLKDHPIFESPFAIDRSATIEIETPEAFHDDLDDQTIHVIPVVDDYDKDWRSGWCTYSTAFDVNPDVEYFCGGVNHKTPTAAAIWRQGNLLHFGFQQSPDELNAVGDQLLLNAIAYISDFTQDRPIAISPSVFVGDRTRPRDTVAAWLKNPDRADWVEDMVTADLWKSIQEQGDVESMVAWAERHTPYLYPDANSKLEIDEDLRAIKMGFDDPRFLESVIGQLASDEKAERERSIRLLARYVPEGPESQEPADWEEWYQANKPFLFATDFGHYRWYIDPLARVRNRPSAQLRGPERRDRG